MEPQPEVIPNSLNVLGYYTVSTSSSMGGLSESFERMGVKVLNVFTAGATYEQIVQAPAAALNVVICPTTSLTPALHMQEKFGTPFIAVPAPYGIENTRDILLKVVDALGMSPEARQIVEEEAAYYRAEVAKLRQYLRGKRVAIFAGAGKVEGFVRSALELGMEVGVIGLVKVRDYLAPETIPHCGTTFEGIRRICEEFRTDPAEVVLTPNDREIRRLLAEKPYDMVINSKSKRKLGWQGGVVNNDAMDQSDMGRGFSGTLEMYRQWAGSLRGGFVEKYGSYVLDELALYRVRDT